MEAMGRQLLSLWDLFQTKQRTEMEQDNTHIAGLLQAAGENVLTSQKTHRSLCSIDVAQCLTQLKTGNRNL